MVPRTLPFTVPASVTGGYGCNEFAHAVQSKAINLVINQTPYEFNKLCQATSRHVSTPVTVVNIPDKNLAVAKSDIILAVEPIADSGYDTSGTNLARSELPVDEDGHEAVHQCTKDAYDDKICGEDEIVPESTSTHTDATVNPKPGLPINNGSSSSQLAKVSLSSSLHDCHLGLWTGMMRSLMLKKARNHQPQPRRTLPSLSPHCHYCLCIQPAQRRTREEGSLVTLLTESGAGFLPHLQGSPLLLLVSGRNPSKKHHGNWTLR